jgi:hypothetical protein
MIAILKLIIPLDLIADGKTRFKIRRNHLNFTMRVATKCETLIKLILCAFLDVANCCHLEINNKVHKTGVYRDIFSLQYDPRSFRQPDDSIREWMVQWMQKSISIGWDTMIFFGGECTMLGKILSSHSRLQYFYTDFPSIYADIIRNYKQPHVELIDYDTWEWKAKGIWKKDLEDMRRSLCCIVNTGYQGMGSNLAAEIGKIGVGELFVISCNPESWARDLEVLDETYQLLEQTEIRTNYSVWIYKLAGRR